MAHSSAAQPHSAHSSLPSWPHTLQGLHQDWTAVGPTLHRGMHVCFFSEKPNGCFLALVTFLAKLCDFNSLSLKLGVVLKSDLNY